MFGKSLCIQCYIVILYCVIHLLNSIIFMTTILYLLQPFREFHSILVIHTRRIMDVSDNNCVREILRDVIITRTCLLTKKALK